jgi:hypothetical protein
MEQHSQVAAVVHELPPEPSAFVKPVVGRVGPESQQQAEHDAQKRKKLFGKFSDGFRPLRPHNVAAGTRDIIEIPVTTFPFFKVPIHVSYLVYLASCSRLAAKTYWRTALTACRTAGVQPSLLLHPLDFLSGEDVPELKFFPGMGMTTSAKLALVSDFLQAYSDSFDVVTMREHAAYARESLTIDGRRSEALS